MKYRAEIDGLRSVAVAPVILFHMGFAPFAGGFVGVDVFFVISGYLITSIILDEINKGIFSFSGFYERRARRILPALYFVLFACCIYLLFFQAPFAARDLAQSIFATVIFAQNILLYFETSNYFDLSSELKPLLHTWSLAIEEQFYVFFPPFLFLVWRYGVRKTLIIFSLIIVLSLGLANWAAIKAPTAAFYMPFTRCWELLIGSGIAVYNTTNSPQQSATTKQLASALGLFFILYSVFAFDDQTVFPSMYTLLPTLGTALIILYGVKGTLAHSLLSSKVLVAIGLASYSAYLWHQPILAVARQETNFGDAASDYVYFFITLCLLTSFSYWFVEKPFRNGTIPAKVRIASYISASLFLLAFSYAAHVSTGFQAYKLANINEDRRFLYIDVAAEVQRRSDIVDAMKDRKKAQNAPAMFTVIGDSMAKDLELSLLMQGISGDMIRLHVSCFKDIAVAKPACNKTRDDIERALPREGTVILAADFAKNDTYEGARALYQHLRKKGYIVKVLGALRFRNIANTTYNFMKSAKALDDLGSQMAKTLDSRNNVNERLKNGIEEQDFIDKQSLFCAENAKTCNFHSPDGRPYFFDELHLTEDGMYVFGRDLKSKLWP